MLPAHALVWCPMWTVEGLMAQELEEAAPSAVPPHRNDWRVRRADVDALVGKCEKGTPQ